MMSHRWRYKGRGSVLIRFFTSSTVRCAAARVILAIPSLFCFQSSPPLFYHSTRIGMNTFPRLSLSDKDLLLETYRTLALEPDDLALAELIDKGENDWVEFKEAACWNARLNRKDDSMRDNVIQEVAAFLNSREGGVVLIGVEDDGNSVGLEGDYKIANQQKQNRDGYRLFLLDHL